LALRPAIVARLAFIRDSENGNKRNGQAVSPTVLSRVSNSQALSAEGLYQVITTEVTGNSIN